MEEILSLLRDFDRYYKSSIPAAYCGLYGVRVKNGQDPDSCINITLAKKRLFEDNKLQELIDKIKQIEELLNAKHK